VLHGLYHRVFRVWERVHWELHGLRKRVPHGVLGVRDWMWNRVLERLQSRLY
jgi:hypothetical protein